MSVWFTGVLFLTVRLLGGLWLLRQLKARFNGPVPETLTLRCRDLAERLGVARAVQLRESLSVNVPLVIGWLRPMILIADKRHQRS
jgi:beta-lactamase regulating signal transducer with metallopeptidase domain